MKKKILIILLFSFAIFHTSAKNVLAVDGNTENFSPTLTNVTKSAEAAWYGMTFGITYKTGFYTDPWTGNKNKTTVFCTDINRPDVGKKYDLKEGKEQWNLAIQAGIGNIIYTYYRGYKNASDPNNERQKRELFTTYAINLFLYEVNGKNVNNLAPNWGSKPNVTELLKNSGYTDIVSNAIEEYKKVNTKFELKFDKTKIKYAYNKNDKIYYSEKIKVSAEYLASSSVTKAIVTVNGKDYDCIKETEGLCSVEETSKNEYRIKIYDNILESEAVVGSSEVSTKFEVQGKKQEYYIASEYVDSNRSTTVQDMVPNVLHKIVESKFAGLDGKFTYVLEPDDCPTALSKVDVSGKQLHGLYENYNDFGELLNVASPSCDKPINNSSFSCGSSTIEKRWVEDIVGSKGGSRYSNKAYCTATFKLDSNLFSSSETKQGNLIYKSDDGEVAKAYISYNCNIPYFKNGTDEKQDISINIGKTSTKGKASLAPSLKIKLFNDAGYISFADTVTLVGESDDGANRSCREDGDNIICTITKGETTKENVSIGFQAVVDYKYSDNNKYGVQKQSPNLDFTFTKIADCDNNCIQMGYGIPVDNNEKLGSYNSTLTLDFQDNNIFKEGTQNLECGFNITEQSIKKDLLYRAIDTTEPFLSVYGEERYTGVNWCGEPMIDADTPTNNYVEVTLKDVSSSCRYLGDINGNGDWDEEDLEWLTNYDDNKNGVDQEVIDSIVSIKQSGLRKYIYGNVDRSYVFENGEIHYDFINTITIKDVSTLAKYVDLSKFIKLGDANLDGKIDQADYNHFNYVMQNTAVDELTLKVTDILGNCNDTADDVRDNLAALKELTIGYESPKEIEDSSPIEVENNDTFSESFEDLGKTLEYKNSSCSVYNSTVKKYITNRPNSDGILKTTTAGVTTTSKTEPLYSFTLTPSTLRKIREYNDSNSYNDFTLDCTEGKKCVSTFITKLVNEEYGNTFANGKCSNRSSFCEVTK